VWLWSPAHPDDPPGKAARRTSCAAGLSPIVAPELRVLRIEAKGGGKTMLFGAHLNGASLHRFHENYIKVAEIS
jgi:hypothetical protein